MSPYVLGEVVRAVMDKGGLTALAIMGGFFVLAYFIREGLSVIKAYSSSKESERAELINFIKNTQQKQDSGVMSLMNYLNETTKILYSLSSRIEEGQRNSDLKHNELLSRFVRTEQVIRDVSRGVEHS